MFTRDGSSAYSFQQEFGDRFKGNRILVTGATGFVGLNLSRALEATGAEVFRAALPDSSGAAPSPVRFLPVDLTEEGAARRLIESVQPDRVFHLAGRVDTRQSIDLVVPTLTHNLLGAVRLMTALVGSSCQRLVTVTSSEAPGLGQRPNSPYAASKMAMVLYAELFAGIYGLPVVIARPHLIFGPHQPPDKLIPYLIHCGLNRIPPRLTSGKRVCDPVYVKDLVRALLHMAVADGAPGMTLDVGTGIGVSVAQIAGRVSSLLGSDAVPEFGAVPDRVGEVPQVADLTPTLTVLPWRPAWSLDEGLLETIDWYRSQGAPSPEGRQSTPREVPE